MNIIEQLVNIYLNKESWHKNKMPYEESLSYHQKMFDRGNIIVYEEDGIVLGYVETWCINYEQFGRICCGEAFSGTEENCQQGFIAYLANVYIEEAYRNSNIIKLLKAEWLKKHFRCKYFVGEARRKKCAPIKVINRQNIRQLLEV